HRDEGEPEDPDRVIAARVAITAAGAGDRPDQPQLLGPLVRNYSGLFEARGHGGIAEGEIGDPREITLGDVEPAQQPGALSGPKGEAPPTRLNGPAAEPVAGELEQQVEEPPPQPSQPRRSWQEADVIAQSTEVADVVRDALELERDATNALCGERNL